MKNKNTKEKEILIVEDDEFLAKALLYEFRRSNLGAKVARAKDGKEALEHIDKSRPAIIILDLIMPKKDGFDFLKEIKEHKKFKDIPIIVLSNLSQKSEKKECMDLGAEEYLVKVDTPIFKVVEIIASYLRK